MSRRRRLVSFRISEEEYERLQKLSDLHGGNISETARFGLLGLLEHHSLEASTERTIGDLETRARALFFELRELLSKTDTHGWITHLEPYEHNREPRRASEVRTSAQFSGDPELKIEESMGSSQIVSW